MLVQTGSVSSQTSSAKTIRLMSTDSDYLKVLEKSTLTLKRVDGLLHNNYMKSILEVWHELNVIKYGQKIAPKRP